MEIKNLKKAAKRILLAVKNNQRIILYSDADLDGTASLLILEETIENFGGEVSARYFPNREKEGYGLNEAALKVLSDYAPGLLIVLDSGISNFKEVEMAKKIGFEVIIIEHHEILNGTLPSADIILNPKQKADAYPFKKLATVGIVYKLCEELLQNKLSSALRQSFLELAALGTLADMMLEEADNKIIIESGLKTIFRSFRPGLTALLKLVLRETDTPRYAAQKIIPILNITKVRNHLTAAYLLLEAADPLRARQLAQELFLKYQEDRKIIKEMLQEVETEITEEERLSPIIFEGSSDWPQDLTGVVASRVCNKYKKPTFIFKQGEEKSRGSVRVPAGINSVKALESCGFVLEMYGGHPPASGFTVKNKNLERLKECLEKYFNECCKGS